MTHSIQQRLRDFSPVMVRLMAGDRIAGPQAHTAPYTAEQIAERANLAVDEVEEISEATSWDAIPIGKALAFCKGCNVDLFGFRDTQMLYKYRVGIRKFDHLRRSKNPSRIRELAQILADATQTTAA